MRILHCFPVFLLISGERAHDAFARVQTPEEKILCFQIACCVVLATRSRSDMRASIAEEIVRLLQDSTTTKSIQTINQAHRYRSDGSPQVVNVQIDYVAARGYEDGIEYPGKRHVITLDRTNNKLRSSGRPLGPWLAVKTAKHVAQVLSAVIPAFVPR